MKESEAKTKFCPHVDQACMASDCMMWDAYKTAEDCQQEHRPPEGEGWTFVSSGLWRRFVHKGDGDCGLKPVCNGCSYPG